VDKRQTATSGRCAKDNAGKLNIENIKPQDLAGAGGLPDEEA
jgi:hypothetical protein